jgi:multicomponent Na+:H+ antiporter subunit B
MRGMTLIVKTITALLIGFILLFGFCVVLTGHLTPGGGFAGGVILAAALLLVVLAFGADALKERLGHNLAVVWESLGAIGFLAVGALGFIAGTFFAHFFAPKTGFVLFAAGSIPYLNVAVGLKVGAGLFGAFLMLAAFRETERAGREEGD